MASNPTSPTSERERLADELLKMAGLTQLPESLFLDSNQILDFILADRRSLLDKVEAEVIGKDEPNLVDDGYQGIKFQSPDYKAINRNMVRDEQRIALAQLRKEIG